MKKLILISTFFLLSLVGFSQQTVTFEASDGLKVTADMYVVDKKFPFMIFFHQAGSSRGEYKEIARKFFKLGYNGLVVDLRVGDEAQYVGNETAVEAKRSGKEVSFMDAEKDVIAALDFAWGKNHLPVVLVGSSYSASLCLKVAKGNDKVKAVVAFSPGEYFGDDYNVKEGLAGFDKRVIALCSQREKTYVEDMFADVDTKLKTVFSPKEGPGAHGAKALWDECGEKREYMWNLNLFFKTVEVNN
jgi:pimeloyl-ACP methyl ester carboxylesterase